MSVSHLVRKAVGTVVTGVVGVGVVEAGKRWGGPSLGRRTVVSATAWGLRGVRAAETGAESMRLYGADLVAEARESLGETAAPPSGTTPNHAHP